MRTDGTLPPDAAGESDPGARGRAPCVPSDRPSAMGSLEPAVLTADDPGFPLSLRRVRPPSERLFVLGDVTALQAPMVAIVGSREPTGYGIKVAYEAGYECAKAGLVVVSGMARGLDARAHRGALDAGGRTVAVLGCGIDQIYPRVNRALLEAVPRQGCLISEYEPGCRPTQWSFPTRNRLIAGLATCLLVVEGRVKGGTSNMVWWMQSLEKPIFAVPGRIGDEGAEGPNLLLHQGAGVYLTPHDILEEFGMRWSGPAPDAAAIGMPAPDAELARAELSGAEATVFDVITPEPAHVDLVAARTRLDAGLLLAALSSLEIQGLIRQLPGKHFALAS